MKKTVDFFTVGTGSVHTVPLWGCDCPVCMRAKQDPTHARTPCGGVLKIADGNGVRYILMDAGDIHIERKYERNTIAGCVLTHYHPDHVQGLLSIRWHGGSPIPVKSVKDTDGFGDLYKNNGILDFSFVTPFEPFDMDGISFTPVPLHHSVPTNGYVIQYNTTKLAYLCDTNGLPTETATYLKAQNIHTVILDCTHSPEKTSSGHNNLTQAQGIYEALQPQSIVLTHIEHDFDVWMLTNPIPKPLQVAQNNQHILSF